MTDLPLEITLGAADADALSRAAGRVALLLPAEGALVGAAARIDAVTAGAVARVRAGSAWARAKGGEGVEVPAPAGLQAEALHLVKLPAEPTLAEARKAGATIARGLGSAGAEVVMEAGQRPADVATGLWLRAYGFDRYKTPPAVESGAESGAEAGSEAGGKGPVTLRLEGDAKGAQAALDRARAVAGGVTFTRDLVNEPANVLTTTDFARRLSDLRELGVTVQVIEEEELARLGMRALLGVGQGSASPSKVVVMEWKGAKGAPLALVGKGVCFDTGGISLKPAEGMEAMTMDMGGAGTVAGVMRTLALRKAKAHVVGLVGLVENMPDGMAQRPGDVVRSMKGDTIEVINTDAEGRLVLADVLWYAQDRFAPAAMIDLATLTGAVIVALGHENAGIFANDDALATQLLAAAGAEGEGAWRLPLAPAYDAMLKSHVADMRNSVGRPAGSITAAQFLRRFVKDATPWVHIDIAGVATATGDHPYAASKGATGWGVMTLDRLVAHQFER